MNWLQAWTERKKIDKQGSDNMNGQEKYSWKTE